MGFKSYSNEDRSLTLSVEESGQEAILTIADGFLYHNDKDITDLIEKAGIKNGLIPAEEIIDPLESPVEDGRHYRIAKSSYQEHSSAKYTLLIDENRLSTTDSQHPLSMKDIALIEPIPANTPLAIMESGDGADSKVNIFGERLNPNIDEVEIRSEYFGENVTFSKDSGRIVTDITGFPYFDKQGRLSVSPHISIDGDIFVEKGEFELSYPVHVEGNLWGDGSVFSHCDIRVNGDLTGLLIVTTKEASISGSVLHARIFAGGNIRINNSTCSRICSAIDLELCGKMVNSLLVAGNRIMQVSEENSVLGCNLIAGNSISIGTVVNDKTPPSELTVTYSPYMREFFAFCNRRETNLSFLGQKISTLSEKLVEAYAKSESLNSTIEIKGLIPKGTHLRIFRAVKEVKTETFNTVFAFDGDSIIELG